MTVPDAAWAADEAARARGRVAMFNAGRPDGLDGWTMDAEQYELVRAVLLELTAEGPVLLKDVVAAAQDRYGSHPAFPKGRLTNYVRFTKVDLEARGELVRVPGSGAQRITRP